MTGFRISDFIEDPTAPRWEDYPEGNGFAVLIRLQEVPESTELLGQYFREEKPENEEPQPEIPDGETQPKAKAAKRWRVELGSYNLNLLRACIVDWRGLTVPVLAGMFPGTPVKAEAPDAALEIPFSPENLEFLLRKGKIFVRWSLTIIKQREGEEEALTKN